MTPDAPCTCDGPGDCERMRRTMTLPMFNECRSNACYRWALSARYAQWPESCKKKPGRKAKEPRPECIHLGLVTDRRDANGEACGCPQKWLWACDVYGQCTTKVRRDKVACCDGCDDYCDTERAPITVRHLMYHVYPMAGNGVWQRNVSRLCERLRIINGKRIVTIAIDPPDGRKPDPTGANAPDTGRRFDRCDSPDAVIAEFGEHAASCEFIVVENDPHLREVKTLPLMMERLPNADGHATLYAQAKGVTRHNNHIAHHWTETLYILYFDYWKLVEKQLQTKAITGAYKKLGPGWCPSQHKSDWHYSGSWYWFRNSELLDRDWWKIDQEWSGIEPYPSQQFAAHEAGCLFHEAAVPAMNLYSRHYWRKTVDPALAQWRVDNVKYFNATHGI